MKFTERELQLLAVLVSNEIEDMTITIQQAGLCAGDPDEELQAALCQLRLLERHVVEAIETGDWAVSDEPPIHTLDPNEAEEEPYEPTQADLDSLDAFFEDISDEGLLE